jgi:DNA-binding XRE family transcriptional regulator
MGIFSKIIRLDPNPKRIVPGFTGYKKKPNIKPYITLPKNQYTEMTGLLYNGQIEVLYNERGMTIEEIAKVAGADQKSIEKVLGIVFHPIVNKKILGNGTLTHQDIIDLYNGGYKLEEIAKKVGVSRRSISRLLKAYGKPRR